MYKWRVLYQNHIERIFKVYTVKASSRQEAIQKSIDYINKKYYINDRLLNHYTITLINN